QEFAAPDFVPDVIFNFAALGVAGRDDILVKIADPQMRNLLIVQGDLIFAIHLFHDHIGQHIVLRRSSENLTWTRIQPRDVAGGLLNVLNANVHSARDLRKTSPAKVFHVLGDDFVLERVLLFLTASLNEQTLAQVAR